MDTSNANGQKPELRSTGHSPPNITGSRDHKQKRNQLFIFMWLSKFSLENLRGKLGNNREARSRHDLQNQQWAKEQIQFCIGLADEM